MNLVDNAVRYAREVQSRVDARDTDGPAAVLTVSDDGPGIPAAERERVFDRFYRTESSRSRESGGTGLGLPIVRDLVRRTAAPYGSSTTTRACVRSSSYPRGRRPPTSGAAPGG